MMHKGISDLLGAQVEINRAVHEANYPRKKGDREPRLDYLVKCATNAIEDLKKFLSANPLPSQPKKKK
jgi:hypothetical protein